MRKFKAVIYFLLSLFLVFNIIFLVLGLLINFNLCNYNYYIKKFDKLNIYHSISVGLNDKLGDVSLKTNIPNKIFSPFTDERWIKGETNNCVKQLFQYLILKKPNLYKIDCTVPEAKFENNLDEYIKSNNLFFNSYNKNEVKNIELESTNIVKSNIDIFSSNSLMSIQDIQSVRKNVNLIYYNVYRYFIFFILILIIILWSYRKHMNNILMWYGYSFISSGIIILLLSLSSYGFKLMLDFPIQNLYLKNLIISVVKDSYHFLISSGIIIISIGTAFMIISYNKINIITKK